VWFVYRSITPGFTTCPGCMRRVFHLSLYLITLGCFSAYYVHKRGLVQMYCPCQYLNIYVCNLLYCINTISTDVNIINVWMCGVQIYSYLVRFLLISPVHLGLYQLCTVIIKFSLEHRGHSDGVNLQVVGSNLARVCVCGICFVCLMRHGHMSQV